METKPFKWRTHNSSAIYVDADMGNDVTGNGTEQHPYQTLGKAYRGHKVSGAKNIICRGLFSEDMADGDHGSSINGDYYGAAIFDGNEQYIIYGFTHNNMMIQNCPVPTHDLTVTTGSLSLAGVGRAYGAGRVGVACDVGGVAGAPTLTRNTTLYFGCIGGNAAVKNQVVASPKITNNSNKIWFGGGGNPELYHMTIYDIPYEKRQKGRNGNSFPNFMASIFGKVAFYADEPLRITESLFTSDCEWYYNDTKIEITGTTSSEREACLYAKCDELGIEENKQPKLTNCIFSLKTSEEIWNDIEKGDFTLKPNTDAVRDARSYCGALPPCLNVPIMNNSDGVPMTWDEKTANGILAVENNVICYNDMINDDKGEILTKVITVDERYFWLTGIYAQYASRFASHLLNLSDVDMVKQTFEVGDTLVEGLYFTNSSVQIKRGEEVLKYSAQSVLPLNDGDIFDFGDSVVEGATEPTLYLLSDSNITNVCYIRSTPIIYKRIKSSEGLETGGVYLNFGDKNITYRGRTIVPKESFVAENDTDTFSCEDENYLVAIVFDDSRVPSQPWVSAQLWGEYFVGKQNNVIQVDTENNPLSSGNYLSWQTSANGGYSGNVYKTTMTDRYCQFKISVKKLVY